MSDRYIDAAFAQAGVATLPVVLAHDGRSPLIAARITKRYGAVAYHGHSNISRFVDQMLMIRATYFLSNLMSSFSDNAVRTRHVLGLPSNRDAPTLFGRQWPGPVLSRLVYRRRRL